MGQPLKSTVRLAKRQRGVVLFIALIALVAMTMAGIALMRSVDTANVIAGNFAFKESALHATDVGAEIGMTALPALVSTTGANATANKYFPTKQLTDAQGIPTTADWSAIPSTNISNGESAQYIVERMCDMVPASGVTPAHAPDINNRGEVTDYCITAPQCSPGVSINMPPFCVAGDIYYRITTRVTGARGTVSVVQSVVTR